MSRASRATASVAGGLFQHPMLLPARGHDALELRLLSWVTSTTARSIPTQAGICRELSHGLDELIHLRAEQCLSIARLDRLDLGPRRMAYQFSIVTLSAVPCSASRKSFTWRLNTRSSGLIVAPSRRVSLSPGVLLFSEIVSCPSPRLIYRVSLPTPPASLSLPAPPPSVSLPRPPIRMLALLLPVGCRSRSCRGSPPTGEVAPKHFEAGALCTDEEIVEAITIYVPRSRSLNFRNS